MSIVAGSRGLLALAFRDLVPMAAARLPPSNAFIVEVFRLLLCLAGGDGRLLAFRPHLFEVRVVRAPDVFAALTAFCAPRHRRTRRRGVFILSIVSSWASLRQWGEKTKQRRRRG